MPLEGLDALVREGTRRMLWEPSETARTVDIGRPRIEQLIPHRGAFLFVDRITDVDPERGKLRGLRSIAADDPVFDGHFPGQPVYPGVLLLETLGQFGLCLMPLVAGHRHEVADGLRPGGLRASRIHHAVFLAPVGPAQRLQVAAALIEANEYRAICAGQAVRDGEICAFGVLEVHFVQA